MANLPPITGASVPDIPGLKSEKSKSLMAKDDFLKLLVAQMKHQNPLEPQDGTEQIAQMTQFTLVEQVTNLAAATEKLAAGQERDRASALVGRNVTYTDADGEPKTGIVERVSYGDDGKPLLTVGGVDDVSPASITEVR